MTKTKEYFVIKDFCGRYLVSPRQWSKTASKPFISLSECLYEASNEVKGKMSLHSVMVCKRTLQPSGVYNEVAIKTISK